MFRKWVEYWTIRKSGLFDPAYYLLENPDVRFADIDPLFHFIEYGWKNGRNPSREFNVRYYLETNPDVNTAGVNPLVHYLKYGQKEGRIRNPDEEISKFVMKVFSPERESTEVSADISILEYSKEISTVIDLLNSKPDIPAVFVEQPIDILIPVYNGRFFLELLLESIVKNTYIPYRILIANDGSTDQSISGYLADFRNSHADVDITIIENEGNLGFVETINRLASLTQNHFAILNTDTEVPPHWLERLMYPILTKNNIASTTPFSNAGVICSFPNFLEDNPIFGNLDVASLDAFFQYVDFEKNYVEVPTGVGFCMGINKNVYERIGMFDLIFGKGYGEENDWCMRAIHAGYKNIIVPNLFVYHKHGGSFSRQEKKEMSKKNFELLINIHPNYPSLVADFIQRDPLKYLRIILKLTILSSQYKPRMVLDHSLGGGANEYSSLLLLKENFYVTINAPTLGLKKYRIKFGGQKSDEISFDMGNIRYIERILKHFNVEEIILNELVGYPKPKILDLLDFLVKLKQDYAHVEFTFMVHDYFAVSPIYNLLDFEIKYCGVPSDLSYCDKCLKLNPLLKVAIPFVAHDYPNLTIALWREKFGNLLGCSSKIVCFSHSSRDILQKAYPNLSSHKFEIAPHVVDWVHPVVVTKTSETINIAVIGHLATHKGTHIVYSLASYIDYYNLNVRVHIFGDILDPFESFKFLKTVIKHGGFEKTDLPNLMESNEIDLVLITSLWPETFSYTAEEAMEMQLPIAVFDYGAPAERVKLYDKGIILQRHDPGYIIEKIFEYLNMNQTLTPDRKENIVFVCVSNNDLVYTRGVLSFAYMTEHKILKYDNKEANIPIPMRYNDAITKLMDSDYSGWVFFIHNDFSLLEPVDSIVEKLDHNHLYGPIGAVLNGDEKKLVGQILQGHDGSLIHYGSKIDAPTLVDTVDCQCLLVHTDLLRKYNLTFDENELLSFHQYIEDFCVNANVNYGIKTYAVQLTCKHISWGKLNREFDLAIDYINSKYPDRKWAGTCTHLS